MPQWSGISTARSVAERREEMKKVLLTAPWGQAVLMILNEGIIEVDVVGRQRFKLTDEILEAVEKGCPEMHKLYIQGKKALEEEGE